jgi:hypothetical protein
MLFAAVTRLVEGLSPETLLTLKVDLLSGHTEINRIHNRTIVNFVLENIN